MCYGMSDSSVPPVDVPPRRSVSDQVLSTRTAIAVVHPVNEKLTLWQGESVKLQIHARRLRSAGKSDPGIAEAARTLLAQVKAQTLGFEEQLVSLDGRVIGHSRIGDTRNSLRMVTQRLREVLETLREPEL